MKFLRSAVFFVALSLLASGCAFWDNFTTLFNTYYNMKRLTTEVEDEFGYYDEKQKQKPRVLAYDRSTLMPDRFADAELPAFLQEFVVSQVKLQPVKIKVDSVLIKGSKILAQHPKSSYIDGTLYLMAKAYFYKSEWLPAQVKCSEVVDLYPNSDFAPAAYLLMAKSMFMQRRWDAGLNALSKTVDLAWGKEQYDILSEAFRLEAELAISQGRLDDAVKPYRRAINQANDSRLQAVWQMDIASIFYRNGLWKEALRELEKVGDYSPDLMTRFEADIYTAASLINVGEYEKAKEILEELEGNRNFDEWEGWMVAQRLQLARNEKKDSLYKATETAGDESHRGNPAIAVALYDRALDYYNMSEYPRAREVFLRVKSVKTPVSSNAGRYFDLLVDLEKRQAYAMPLVRILDTDPAAATDTMKATVGLNLFDAGRIHEQLGNNDSALFYYTKAVALTPQNFSSRARYLFALARVTRADNSVKADDYLEEIVEKYPLTEYGEEARYALGYTEEAVIDPAVELFSSGQSNLFNANNYQFALQQFTRLYTRYPNDSLAPRALYMAGYIWERYLGSNDSALALYGRLVDTYSLSQWAQDVRPGVLYARGVREGVSPDSLDVILKKKNPQESPKGVQFNDVRPSQVTPDGTIINNAVPPPAPNSGVGIKMPIQPLDSAKPASPIDSIKSKRRP